MTKTKISLIRENFERLKHEFISKFIIEPKGIIMHVQMYFYLLDETYLIQGHEINKPQIFGLKIYRTMDIEEQKFKLL